MQRIMVLAGACLLATAAASVAGVPPSAMTPGTLGAEIEGLRARQPAWRKIPWKTCLIDGLQESRASKKPLLFWVFIDRPVDDARC